MSYPKHPALRPYRLPLTSYLLYDGHGSTRQLVDSTASITAQYSFDAYGHMLGQQSSSQQKQATSLLYAGEQFDNNLQQYYLRARYYNQNNGRFNRLDPVMGSNFDPQSLHKYAYAHSDPVNNLDPSGAISLLERLVVTAIISSLAGLITLKVTESLRVAGFVAAALALLTFFTLPLLALGVESLAVGLGASVADLANTWFIAQLVAVIGSHSIVRTIIIVEAVTLFAAKYPLIYQKMVEFSSFVASSPEFLADLESIKEGLSDFVLTITDFFRPEED